jgi:GntR family transcriptional regulator, rspAB operon transcriptional repressor
MVRKMSSVVAFTDLAPGGADARLSAAQRVERELHGAITRVELAPGARLSEQDLASRLGVSRQPVREALLALRARGLVNPVHRRGTSVARISVEGMKQVRFVREALETAVVRRACETFDPAHRAGVDESLEAQRRAARDGDHDAFQRADERFHAALAAGAGCDLAWRAVLDVKCHMDRVCALTLTSPETLAEIIAQHLAIVAAIDARDPDAAEANMRHHLTEILRSLPRVIAEHGAFFE